MQALSEPLWKLSNMKKFLVLFFGVFVAGFALAVLADRQWKSDSSEIEAVALLERQRASLEAHLTSTLSTVRKIANAVGTGSIAVAEVDRLNGVYNYWGESSDRFVVIDSNIIYSRGEQDFFVLKHKIGDKYSVLLYLEGKHTQTFDYTITLVEGGLIFVGESDRMELTRLKFD